MFFHSFLIKYGEIGIKGKNRYLFEDALVAQLNHALKPVEGDFEITKEQGRIYVNTKGEYDYDEAVEAMTRVFGVVGVCPMVQVEDHGFEQLAKDVLDYLDHVYPDKKKTFKVNSRRARKNFPMDSQEINMELGGIILDAYPEMKVDEHNPDIMLNIEISSMINIY